MDMSFKMAARQYHIQKLLYDQCGLVKFYPFNERSTVITNE